jgi:hypothetical protein
MMVDESQDTNGVLAGVIRAQDHLQRIFVGDSQQRLFSWRGTVDMMTSSRTPSAATSRRASASATPWPTRPTSGWSTWTRRCACAGCPRSTRAWTTSIPPTRSSAAPTPPSSSRPCARSSWALTSASSAARTRSPPSSPPPTSCARPARPHTANWRCSRAGTTSSPTWRSEKPDGSFATFVRLIERYGTHTVRNVAANCVSPREADFVVSTVHKVKGLEWPTVLLDRSLMPSQEEGQDIAPGELMTRYVAVTRAKESSTPAWSCPSISAAALRSSSASRRRICTPTACRKGGESVPISGWRISVGQPPEHRFSKVIHGPSV